MGAVLPLDASTVLSFILHPRIGCHLWLSCLFSFLHSHSEGHPSLGEILCVPWFSCIYTSICTCSVCCHAGSYLLSWGVWPCHISKVTIAVSCIDFGRSEHNKHDCSQAVVAKNPAQFKMISTCSGKPISTPPLSLRTIPSVAFEKVPTLAWFMIALSCPFISCKVTTLCLDSSIVSPLWLHWVKGVCMFRCNLPPALLAEWLGSLTCHCGNTGVERTQNKESTYKVDSEENKSPTAPARIQTCNLLIVSLAL